MRRALFVPDQDVVDVVGVVQHGIEGGQDLSARKAKDMSDTFLHQAFPDDLRAAAFHWVSPAAGLADVNP